MMADDDPWASYDERFRERLIGAFLQALRFLMEKCKHEGWRPSSNYLREHVRCATGLSFANAISPTVLRILKDQYPELRPWIETNLLKSEKALQNELF